MSCETSTVEALRQAGHRLTPQRMLVTSVVRHAGRHITASEILDEVKQSYPYLNASTVYRTLGVLRDLSLVAESNFGDGDTSYEWLDTPRHHHLSCRECGSVRSLDHRHLEDLGAEIMGDYDFRPDLDHFVIAGLCRSCYDEARRG